MEKSRYCFDDFDTIRYIDIEFDISIIRYIDSSLICVYGLFNKREAWLDASAFEPWTYVADRLHVSWYDISY